MNGIKKVLRVIMLAILLLGLDVELTLAEAPPPQPLIRATCGTGRP